MLARRRNGARHAVAGAATILALAACGGRSNGTSSFDEAALRARILARSPAASADVIDATVDVVRNACESGDRRAIPQLRSEDPDGYDLARFACPEKVAAMTATGG